MVKDYCWHLLVWYSNIINLHHKIFRSILMIVLWLENLLSQFFLSFYIFYHQYRIMAVLNVERDIITSILASPIEWGVMYVETFKTDIIGIKRHNVMLHWPIFSSIRVNMLIYYTSWILIRIYKLSIGYALSCDFILFSTVWPLNLPKKSLFITWSYTDL
jgi:hypothetical protein